MWIALAFALTIIGVCLLNENGSYTSNKVHKWVALALHLTAAVICIFEYGTARGLFVYLGALAFLGMLYALLLPLMQGARN